MIKYIAVDPFIWEKAKANHLGLLRLTFDRAKTITGQYEIVCLAREFYGDEEAVLRMEDDIKYSDKPKF